MTKINCEITLRGVLHGKKSFCPKKQKNKKNKKKTQKVSLFPCNMTLFGQNDF
jgi:hypothetical protein